MRETFMVSLRATLVTLVITGLAYPLLVTGLARVLFPEQALGSLVRDDTGRVIGSELIGQQFVHPAYLHPRPSAAGDGYDAVASSGSNLGPTSSKLRDRAIADLEKLRAENPDAPKMIPVDLVTASGSGLDPDLSPAAAQWQVARIARARAVAPDRVIAVVRDSVQPRALGLLGEPRVNVLRMNRALDRRFGKPPGSGRDRTSP
jgi:potassium-transporting ATPase KdpC subunit